MCVCVWGGGGGGGGVVAGDIFSSSTQILESVQYI